MYNIFTSNKDVFTADGTKVLDGSNGKVACNSYEFYQKDIAALQSLNVKRAKSTKLNVQVSIQVDRLTGVSLSVFNLVATSSSRRHRSSQLQGN